MLSLMTGLAAGALIAAVAGARRTADAFEQFTDVAVPAELTVEVTTRRDAERVAAAPGVAAVAWVGPIPAVILLELDGHLVAPPTDALIAVTDDRYGDTIERPRLIEGRRPEPGTSEAVINAAFRDETGVDVGDRVALVAFTEEVIHRYPSLEALTVAYSADPSLARRSTVSIVGRGVRAVDLVRDAASRPSYMTLDRSTVASMLDVSEIEVDRLAFSSGHQLALRVAPGADPDAVLTAIRPFIDPIGTVELSAVRDDVTEATQPYVVALVAFGALAGFATVIVIGSAYFRQSVLDAGSDPTLRSLGASRRLLSSITIGREIGIAIVGVLIAVAVAVPLSALFPIGPAARADPGRSLHVDLFVITLVAAAALAGAIAIGAMASRRTTRRHRRAPSSAPGHVAPSLPLTWAIGLHFAFPPRGNARLLLRSTLIALSTAIVGGCAVAVFASSLDELFEHPPRHGWQWDLAVTCNQGYCDLPVGMADSLRATPGVRGWSFLNFATVEIDGHQVPLVAAGLGRGDLEPFTVTDGRAPSTDVEIGLGATTMGELDVEIGDTVTLTSGQQLDVVGQTVFSGLGPADARRASLGVGASMTTTGWFHTTTEPTPPDALVVAVDGDVASAVASLQAQIPDFTVLELRRPASLEAWPDLRVVPAVLGLLLGALALTTLAHGFATSTRLLRRDLTVLNALGMPDRSLTRTILAQATIVLVTAFVIGAPIGTLAGFAAWRAVTDRLGVSSTATISPLIPLIAVPAVLVATLLVVAIPARLGGRRTDPTSLRGE